jgi:hypothetical protein
MRYVLQVCVLLAAIGSSAARAQQGQQQVQPVPLVPTPLIQSQTSTACLVGCNTQVMTCQNACVLVGPPFATPTPSITSSAVPNSAGSSPCTLSCTSQQLLCQQACNRTPQQ